VIFIPVYGILLLSGTLIGLFSQIRTGGDIVRGRAIKFLLVKIKTEGTELLNKEAEIHLLEEIQLCMGEVCIDFKNRKHILVELRSYLASMIIQ
jgi:hypothetical protein